jgi:DNA-binding FadR family transcriptional regulator
MTDVRATKLAVATAERIVADIAAADWREGTVLGSEAELQRRYGVSRAVLRQSTRLLELQEVARMRRGPGGGLVVGAPTLESVADALSVYLFYVQANLGDLLEAQVVVESAAAALAPDRMTEADLIRLRDLVDRPTWGPGPDSRDLHRMVAAATGNAALEFLVDVMDSIAGPYLRSARPDDVAAPSAVAEHAAIAAAIIAGDGGLAAARMRDHLRTAAMLSGGGPGPARRLDLPEVGQSRKLPEVTARAIIRDIAAAGWPVGRLLSSEAGLMSAYGVSRAVLREAVHILEHLDVAVMRRGPGGGLFISQPGAGATRDGLALQLARRGVTPSQLFEIRAAVEMEILERVIKTIDDDGLARLTAVLERRRRAEPNTAPDIDQGWHVTLGELSGNPVLELLARVLVQLTELRWPVSVGGEDPRSTGAVLHAHDTIVSSVAERDADLARFRMRRHLEELLDFVSHHVEPAVPAARYWVRDSPAS